MNYVNNMYVSYSSFWAIWLYDSVISETQKQISAVIIAHNVNDLKYSNLVLVL